MPPKTKVDKESIISHAFEIIEQLGVHALSARELGRRMGTSSSPIFTFYSSMDELKCDIRIRAINRYKETVCSLLDVIDEWDIDTLFGAYILFAVENPIIYRLIFLWDNLNGNPANKFCCELCPLIDECIEKIKIMHQLSDSEALFIFEQLWFYCYGLSNAFVLNFQIISIDEIKIKINQMITGLVVGIKAGIIKI